VTSDATCAFLPLARLARYDLPHSAPLPVISVKIMVMMTAVMIITGMRVATVVWSIIIVTVSIGVVVVTISYIAHTARQSEKKQTHCCY
jgi:hypothetical protein